MKKKVSIKDVAKFANVSPGTVSNYLNKTTPVNEHTAQQIQKAIDTLQYKRNVIASSLRRAKTNTIGVILPDIRNPFYSELFFIFENLSRERGYNTVLGNFDYEKKTLQDYLELFQSRRVDAIVVCANYSINLNSIIKDSDVPCIVIEPANKKQLAPTIGIDNKKGAYDIVNYLIEKGHKDIAIITSSISSTRYEGYKQALKDAGLKIQPRLIQSIGKFSTNLVQQGREAMTELLESREKFTACFVIADMLSIGAVDAIKRANYKIPEDIAIASFDNIPISEHIEPKLTTVAQPVKEIATKTFDICLNVIKDNKFKTHEECNPELIIRETI
jgi:LacI family transcriptional regulator